MENLRSRRTENLVYGTMWVIAVGLYVLDVMRGRAEMSEQLLDWRMGFIILRTLLPFVVLFIVNNYLLIPRLLLRNRTGVYFIAVGALVLLMWTYQYVMFMPHFQILPHDIPPALRPPHPRSLLPLPVLLDFTYSMLVVGANMAVALLFQRFDDRLKQESLTKANAENELSYLKAQINPHFYMNMLNNIHGMIEIDPEKAQAMVIDMSQLMRYMLYDSSQTRIPLANEIAFLENYLRIMRRRFPENRVAIRSSFPTPDETAGIEVPPLLSLVFVENAFKHGISYRHPSFVEISISLTDKEIITRCVNSRHQEEEEALGSGIGLRNISQRLALIYGEAASLEIEETESEYIVNLCTPI